MPSLPHGRRDTRCGHGSPEAIVDVDDGETGSARIKHCEQRSDAAQRRAVSDASGNRDDGGSDKARDHARHRAVGSGYGDDGIRCSEGV